MFKGWIILPDSRADEIIKETGLIAKPTMDVGDGYTEYLAEIPDLEQLDPYWGEAVWFFEEV